MRTRVKISGVTAPEDAVAARSAGADYVGIVLTEGPRSVSRERAREIAQAIAAEEMLVAMFDEEPPDVVARAIAGLPIHAVQVAGWTGRETGLPCDVWHVLRGPSLPDPATLPLTPLCTYLLESQDASHAGWDWARSAVNGGVRLFVAGGLNPDNVAALVGEVRPFGVDASTGLEREAGRKDAARIRTFIERIREADRLRPRLS